MYSRRSASHSGHARRLALFAGLIANGVILLLGEGFLDRRKHNSVFSVVCFCFSIFDGEFGASNDWDFREPENYWGRSYCTQFTIEYSHFDESMMVSSFHDKKVQKLLFKSKTLLCPAPVYSQSPTPWVLQLLTSFRGGVLLMRNVLMSYGTSVSFLSCGPRSKKTPTCSPVVTCQMF